MSVALTDDNVELHYQVTGTGTPILFIHEFAGDMTSWEPQMQHFGAKYMCISYNARGYPPSSVPKEVSSYSQQRAVADALTILDHLKIDKAHIVGLSMGGFATLHFGLTHPDRALSLCVAGCGYGAEPEKQEIFREESKKNAEMLLNEGMEAFAEYYAHTATRLAFKYSNPRGFKVFKKQLASHSALGSANTQLGVQRERPSLYDLTDQLKALRVPTLILHGDEDDPCLVPGLMLKEVIPTAAMAIVPNCGHTINLEKTNTFNTIVEDFISYAESGRWPSKEVVYGKK